MEDFLMGAVAMALATIGLYFLRFWRETGDRLFAIFCLSFWLLAASRVMLVVIPPEEEDSWVYLIRLVAFALIIAAVLDKNRSWADSAGESGRGRHNCAGRVICVARDVSTAHPAVLTKHASFAGDSSSGAATA